MSDPSDPIGWLPTASSHKGSHQRLVWGHDATGIRMNHLVMLGDTIATVSDWAAALGVTPTRVAQRLRHGWAVLDALAGEPRFEHDEKARRFVDENGAATLQDIGDYFGLSRERIRQIETAALGKARGAALKLGMDAESFLYGLMQRTDQWDGEMVGDTVFATDGRQTKVRHLQARIIELLGDGQRWSTRELAARTRARRTSVATTLQRLRREGRVERERVGNAFLYALAAGERAA